MSSTVGASFLIEPIPEDTFVPEDFTAEQREMARAAADFVDGEVMSRLDDIQAKGPEMPAPRGISGGKDDSRPGVKLRHPRHAFAAVVDFERVVFRMIGIRSAEWVHRTPCTCFRPVQPRAGEPYCRGPCPHRGPRR